MTADLRALHPELFEIAEQLRAAGGDVRIRCIRTDTDDDGRGGTVVAGKMPPRDPNTFDVSAESIEKLQQHYETHGLNKSRRGRR